MLKNSPLIRFVSLALALVAVCGFTSCLGSDDNEFVTYDDTAVTAFTLGTVNVVNHVTASDGVTDSTYVTTYDASKYPFYINQLTREIYNPDSLRLNTDMSAALCTITSKNSTLVLLNLYDHEGKDSLAYYSSTDSIDFSSPVRVRVYNDLRTAYREYTVRVNVHQEDSLAFHWNATTVDGLRQVGDRRIVEKGGRTYLFGNAGGHTVGFGKTASGWQPLAMATELGAEAYRNLVVKGDAFYAFDGVLRSSTDGQTWTTLPTPNSLGALIGASEANLYALDVNGGILSSADNGATWTADGLDSDAGNLPTDNINFVCKPSVTNTHTNTLILIGTRDGKTRIWKKVEENAANAERQPWAYYNDDPYQRHTLPVVPNLQVVNYNGGLVATGGDLTRFWSSQDEGLTWFTDTTYTLPDGVAGQEVPFAMAVDGQHVIYVSLAGSPLVLNARIAHLGWTTEKKAITQ